MRNDKTPDFSALTAACEKIGQGLSKRSLVILESTVYPGVTTRVIKPILEQKSGLKAGKDFGLAYCSERIDPENTIHRLNNTPRVIGGIDETSSAATSAIYGIIVKAPVIEVKDCQTAELVKLVENVYRDVNIAFINEIALLCEETGPVTLENDMKWEKELSFIPEVAGDKQKVEFLLYKNNDESEPYLKPLYLWIDVRE